MVHSAVMAQIGFEDETDEEDDGGDDHDVGGEDGHGHTVDVTNQDVLTLIQRRPARRARNHRPQ